MIKIKILSEDEDPIVISGTGENIRIPRTYPDYSPSALCGLFELGDEWKICLFLDSVEGSEQLLYPAFRSTTYLDKNGIKVACVDGVLQYLGGHDLIDPDDNDDKFVIYEIILDDSTTTLYVYLEILDGGGEIEFELEDNTSIIPNLISYERKGIRKTKK